MGKKAAGGAGLGAWRWNVKVGREGCLRTECTAGPILAETCVLGKRRSVDDDISDGLRGLGYGVIFFFEPI